MIDINEYEWNKFTIGERIKLLELLRNDRKVSAIELLRNGRKVSAVRYVCASSWMGIKEAKLLVESGQLRKKVAKSDPTRMSPRDELRAKVLRVLSDMFLTTADLYMTKDDKYETITDSYMPKLMAICMED